ncbi:hypothetical protein [Edaphobacter sp.]|uniref:hypothetical protein n=1 Tax=Edaphobacter sp. TaxID=1934404 RepID=UPI002DBB43CA|nr:hypothetical protein [Edaphobacter sp.]HEU5339628.1 hypothetical protein [Edaphobacter sp.]
MPKELRCLLLERKKTLIKLWKLIAASAGGVLLAFGLCGFDKKMEQSGHTSNGFLSFLGLWLFILSALALIALLAIVFGIEIFGGDDDVGRGLGL